MKRAAIEAIFATLQKANPHPRTELEYKNPFTFLVSVILSAQATDVSVNKATKDLFARADTPVTILALGEEGLKRYIRTIGLYNAKAKNVIAMCAMLLAQFDGKIPETREELQLLPGVGRKTASVWLNNILNMPTIAVDTHVFRVANRLGLVKTKTPNETEAQLEKIVPEPYRLHAHHWLILHGRYICVARKPRCAVCPIITWCEFKDKNL